MENRFVRVEVELISANGSTCRDVANAVSGLSNGTEIKICLSYTKAIGGRIADNWQLVPSTKTNTKSTGDTSKKFKTFHLLSPRIKGNEDIMKCAALLKEVDNNTASGIKFSQNKGLRIRIGAKGLTHENLAKICQNFVKYEDAIDTIVPFSRRTGSAICDRLFRSNKLGVVGPGASNKQRHDAIAACSSVQSLVKVMNPESGRIYKLYLRDLDNAMHPTMLFSQHSMTVNKKKIRSWIMLCLALVNNSAKFRAPRALLQSRTLDEQFDAFFQYVVKNEHLHQFYLERRANLSKKRKQPQTTVSSRKVSKTGENEADAKSESSSISQCCCCSEKFSKDEMCSCQENGHLCCKKCIRKYAAEVLSLNKNSNLCCISTDGCQSEINIKQLEYALPQTVYEKLHEMQCKTDVKNRLQNTALKGLSIDTQWDGGISLNGLLPDTIETDLLGKMKFVNSDAQPFAATKLLRTLIDKVSDNLPPLHLLLAAEASPYSNEDSQKHMDDYLKLVRERQDKLHPWALIVAARLDSHSSDTLLALYIELFPNQEKYIGKNELDRLKQIKVSSSSMTKNESDVFLERWSTLKDQYRGEVNSKATEDLFALVGLRKVKEEVIYLWKTALQLKRMDKDTREKNQVTTNYCFVGNPGSGKTSVCRLFAKILRDSGLRSKNTFNETTAQRVKDDGSDKFRSLVKKAVGGTLFIDEAYDLNPVGDTAGRAIVNELLTISENDRDKVSIVLAGYEDDFEKKFFAYNVGLKSRFKMLVFEDFDEMELKQIWNIMRQEKQWSEENNVALVAAKRLCRASGRKGFGNARAVRQLLETATKAAMDRLGPDFSMDRMSLKIEDVIGKDPRLANKKLQRVLDSIYEKIGWKRVKKMVMELIELCGINYERELLGKQPFNLFLNRMFLGNPGTGKTTCAKLYGSLLKELGFLSDGEVVVKTASDFIGGYIGQSQTKTVEILDNAKGKVLVIDEAYALDAGSNANAYGKQVLATIVEKVQGGPSDDIAVLLLGYEDQMIRMINESNPGLARRFPKEHAFYFDDYEDSELLEILDFNVKKQEVEVSMGFCEKALNILQIQRKQPNFGNAGAVELLLKGAMQRASQKFTSAHNSSFTLDSEDIVDPGSARAEKKSDALDELDKLYRMDKIKEKLQKMKKNWEVARRDGSDEPEIGHFCFMGSPGTGKTTVARLMSDILFSLALKPLNVFVETSGLGLTGQYAGQTKTTVHDHLKKAKGGVLFIDEAYTLGEGPYGKEACDALVAAMTNEDFSDVLIVIAGYSAAINEMLNSNEGLKSRFTNFFEFPDWEINDCLSFFKACARGEGFKVDEEGLNEIRDGCRRLKQLKGWGNGRDVTRLFKQSKENRAERVYDNDEIEKKIRRADIKASITSMLQARIGKLSDPEENPLAELDKLFRMEEIKAKIVKLQKTWSVERDEGNDDPSLGHFCFTGSPGCGKTTVARAIAKVLFGLELKASDKIVETSALELTGEFVGQTKKKVKRQLQDAKGGVLFIDEAYSFHGEYGQEAIDTLVAAMTSPEYADVLIVIAGYPVEIDDMLQKNPGLKSRFSHFFCFPDWTADDCVKFFIKCTEVENFAKLDTVVVDGLKNGCQDLIGLDGWANGRDTKRLWDESKSNRAVRLEGHHEKEKTILPRDVDMALESMIETRKPKTGRHGSKALRLLMDNAPVCALASENDSRLIPLSRSENDEARQCSVNTEVQERTMVSSVKDGAGNEADKCDGEPVTSETSSCDGSMEVDIGDDARDNGVPDEVWDELQTSKQSEEKSLQEIAKLNKELGLARQAAEEARRRHDEELERIRKEKECEEQKMARKKAEEEEARRQKLEQKRLKEMEERRQRLKEKRRKQEAIKEKLRMIGPCPAGFNWHRVRGGWRCGGGSHFVSNKELQRRYGFDV